jgi:hypothetical protein
VFFAFNFSSLDVTFVRWIAPLPDERIEQDGVLYPVAIKKTAHPGKNDIRAFAQLDKLGKDRGMGAVLCLQPERIAFCREAISIPVWEV